MVRDFQFCIGEESREQFKAMTGQLPDAVCACVGGGSNSAGSFAAFLNDPVDLYGVEPLGKSSNLGDHAATLTYGNAGLNARLRQLYAEGSGRRTGSGVFDRLRSRLSVGRP